MEKFKCVCDENLDNKTFKKHFKKCPLFKQNFSGIDFLISMLLKAYNPLLIKNFLLRFIKMIESNVKKGKGKEEAILKSFQSKDSKELNINHNIKMEPRNRNNNINGSSSLSNELIENYNFKTIYKGSKISDEEFKKITNFCSDKTKVKNNKYKVSKEITEFLKQNIGNSENEWLVFIIDVKKDNEQNNYDFCIAPFILDSTMTFIINDYKFHIICY